MLNKFINSLRHLNDPSGFELYLNNIQRSGRIGVPSMNEARRDYSAFLKYESRF
ncbi:MAG: hypothetical protein IIC84_01080 [Chloroflexi bacterium]|nr:hypothetical protein [Chloroflexota bacterium]